MNRPGHGRFAEARLLEYEVAKALGLQVWNRGPTAELGFSVGLSPNVLLAFRKYASSGYSDSRMPRCDWGIYQQTPSARRNSR